MHFIGNGARHGPCRFGLGPEVFFRKCFSQIFKDGEGFPDRDFAMTQNWHPPCLGMLGDLLFRVRRIEQYQCFIEVETGHGHGQPWAQRPGRVILVANDKIQFGHLTTFSPLHGFREIAKRQRSHKDKTCSQYNEHDADFKIGKRHGENHRRNEIGEIDVGAVNGGHALAFVGAHRPQKGNAANPIQS